MSRRNVTGQQALPFRSVPERRADATRGTIQRLRAENAKLRASYDAAQTVNENEKHWAAVDSYSADAANSSGVRQTLRNRARYEVANNCYGRRLVHVSADFVVGVGPQLQLLTDDDALNSAAERAWKEWDEASGFSRKLRVMDLTTPTDGEVFGHLGTDEELDSKVKLDMTIFETELVAAPMGQAWAVQDIDGIRLDERGKPVAYSVLNQHPGGPFWYGGAWESTEYPAREIIHYFHPDRPGQHRGIPEIMAALPLFAQLRRYTLATVTAAEAVANFAAVLQNNLEPDEADKADPMDAISIERGMMLTLPDGYSMNQVKAEQPTTVYSQFVIQLIGEISACNGTPPDVILNDSSRSNFSSSRLLLQAWTKSIDRRRDSIRRQILERVFRPWLMEWALVSGNTGLLSEPPPHEWIWSGIGYIDPKTEADAEAVRLDANTDTLADIYARRGLRWENQLRQRAREKTFAKEIGLAAPAPVPVPASASTMPSEMPEEMDDEEQEEEGDE